MAGNDTGGGGGEGGGGGGGGQAQPPRFGLNLTFYQLITIIDKSKKEPKNINHISNSLKTTGSFTLFHVM